MVRELASKTPQSQDVPRYSWLRRYFTLHPCPREMLSHAAESVQNRASGDQLLIKLARKLVQLRRDGRPGQTAIQYRIDGVLSRILVDALRRFGMRYIRVHVLSYVQSGRIRAVVIFHHRGREERRHLEVKLK